jgi:hypothetical protein
MTKTHIYTLFVKIKKNKNRKVKMVKNIDAIK